MFCLVKCWNMGGVYVFRMSYRHDERRTAVLGLTTVCLTTLSLFEAIDTM